MPGQKPNISSNKITPAMAEEMKLHFFRTRSVTKVASKFRVARTTVYALKKQQEWDADLEKVIAGTRKAAVQQVISENKEKLRRAQMLRDKVLLELSKQAELGASVTDYVKIAKYVDELESDQPTATGKMDALLAILNQLATQGPDEQKRIIENLLAGLGVYSEDAANRIGEILARQQRTPN